MEDKMKKQERIDPMNSARQEVLIKTKLTNEDEIKKLAEPIIGFANKHEIYFELFKNNNGDLIAVYGTKGKTSAYCKGVMSEVKQMLKDMFNCKIQILIYMY